MKIQTKLIIASLLVITGVLFRLIPHAANMTPLVAIALVAGVYLGRPYALAVPFLAMIIGDLFIGFYDWPVMLAVYGSLALVGYLGFALKEYNRLETRAMMSVVASTVFFLITNWAVWQFSSMYAASLAGLIESYTLALPFYRSALVGDLFFTMSLFAAFELALYLSPRYSFRKEALANS